MTQWNRLVYLICAAALVGSSACSKRNGSTSHNTEHEAMGEMGGAAAREQYSESDVIVPNVVHFAYDSSSITPDAMDILSVHADKLRMNNESTLVTGHCDDRGTKAYNIALGWRRAEAVKMMLVKKGLPSGHVRTASAGKEQPVAFGDNEESYAKNRRAELRLVK